MSEHPKVGDTYYRYEDGMYYENYGREYHTRPDLLRYRVVKVTPCGVWLVGELLDKHFVLNGARKRFAYPTKELAEESYLIRKQHHVQHCEFRLRKAKHFLKCAENMDTTIDLTFKAVSDGS